MAKRLIYSKKAINWKLVRVIEKVTWDSNDNIFEIGDTPLCQRKFWLRSFLRNSSYQQWKTIMANPDEDFSCCFIKRVLQYAILKERLTK